MKAEKGLLLGGRYRLDDLLATGGMGEVWTGHDESVGRVVAVKVLREEFTGNQEFLRRLRTEARNSSALSHENIAQMYDYGEQNGTGFLVMELVPGEPLADLLDRKPVLPPTEMLQIVSATARGLEHAHQASVVHRDVKPGNILLQASIPGVPPKVKITDFGVSLAANQAPMTATGMVMGTAQYLSPEQAIGKPATGRSDLYALGVIAYEATAGKRPFTGKSPVDIAIAHVNDPVPPLPPDTDPRIVEVIMKLLDKDPDQRYSSAGEVADELDRIYAEMTSQEPPTPKLSRRKLRAKQADVSAGHDAQVAANNLDASGAPLDATPGGSAHSVNDPQVVVVPGAALPPTRRSARMHPRNSGTRNGALWSSSPVPPSAAAAPAPGVSNIGRAPAVIPPPAIAPQAIAPQAIQGQRLAPHPAQQPALASGLPNQATAIQPQPVMVARKDVIGQKTPPTQPRIPRIAVFLLALLAIIVAYVVIQALMGSTTGAMADNISSIVAVAVSGLAVRY